MLRLLKRRRRAEGLTGLGLLPDGIALAHVRRAAGGAPELTRCEHRACGAEPAARRAALRELVRAHGLAGSRCVAVLEPGDYQLLQVEAPAVPPEELRAAVRWQVRDLLDYHVDDAVIDVFDVPGDERPGRPMYVVAARAADVQAVVDLAREAELELEAIDIAELALRNVAACMPAAERGLALVRLRAAEGLILIVRAGALQLARNVEFGAASLSAPGGGGALHDSLALEVQRSLDYYDSTFRQAPVTRVVVAPFEGDAQGLAEHLHASLGLDSDVMDLNEILTPAEPVAPQVQARALEAVGGALRTEERSL